MTQLSFKDIFPDLDSSDPEYEQKLEDKLKDLKARYQDMGLISKEPGTPKPLYRSMYQGKQQDPQAVILYHGPDATYKQ